jgi:1-acyl-sn-glycerol-3-phosphate acyltransferase
MALARSILFTIVYGVATLVGLAITVASVPFGPAAMRAAADRWARWYIHLARAILGIRLRVEGAAPVGGALIAAKHQSMYETMAMPLLLGDPVLVMKRELERIPVWGWLARRYGMIAVDRAGGAAALRAMLKAAQAALAEGRPVVIFPEGTRVAPGEHPPLQPGFAGLYRALGVPVVPLAIASGAVWRRGFVKGPGEIVFRFGAPIPHGLSRSEVEARVHEAINALERR